MESAIENFIAYALFTKLGFTTKENSFMLNGSTRDS